MQRAHGRSTHQEMWGSEDASCGPCSITPIPVKLGSSRHLSEPGPPLGGSMLEQHQKNVAERI